MRDRLTIATDIELLATQLRHMEETLSSRTGESLADAKAYITRIEDEFQGALDELKYIINQ